MVLASGRSFLGQYVAPIGSGFLIFLVVAALLWLPYVVVQYRRRGAVGSRRAWAQATFVLYLIVAWALVLLPLPDVGGRFCLRHTVEPNLELLAWVGDMLTEWRRDGGEPLQLLANKALWVRVFNVALLVPFGVYLRRWFRRGLLSTVLLGLTLSLAFEVTQLTGVFGLYPCAYRTFDVDDLMANTLGAAVGWLIAPLVVLLPRRRGSDDEIGAAGAATVPRRGVADLIDLLLGVAVTAGLSLLALLAHDRWPGVVPGSDSWVLDLAVIVVGFGIPLVVVPRMGGGATPGKGAVRMRIVRAGSPAGRRPGLVRLTARAAVLWGPLLLPVLVLDLVDPAVASTTVGASLLLALLVGLPVGWVLLVVLVVVARADDRGPADLVAGTAVIAVPGGTIPPAARAAADGTRPGP